MTESTTVEKCLISAPEHRVAEGTTAEYLGHDTIPDRLSMGVSLPTRSAVPPALGREATRRIVVVDDRADARSGRVGWLAAVPETDVRDLDFAEAMTACWDDVDLAVLDGRDDRATQPAQVTAGSVTVRSYDRFLGPRVAQQIRRHRSPTQTRIVLISAYARENEILARRCHEAGVDFLYDLHELNDAEAFVHAVLNPDPSAAATLLDGATRWEHRGMTRPPRLTEAVQALEASPAGVQLLFDEPAADHPGMGHHLRVLREQLGRLMALQPAAGGGMRDRNPSKRLLSHWLRRAMGLPEVPGE